MPLDFERTCANHPDRQAIGVCVMTGKALCAECSTRYEGVNYSREGLEMLKAQRLAAGRTSRSRVLLSRLAMVVLCPLLLAGLYFSFWALLRELMSLRPM